MRALPFLLRASVASVMLGGFGCSSAEAPSGAGAVDAGGGAVDAGSTDGGGAAGDAGGAGADGGTASGDGGGGAIDPAACVLASGAGGASAFTEGTARAEASVAGRGCARVFALNTTFPLRGTAPSSRFVGEIEGLPSLQTKSPLFDALYTLALTEARESSVASIKDYAFQNGTPLPCPAGGCFETGELWNYVWTRDTSYAAHLGLASLDPVRAMNSLLFKVSPRRGGGGEEIVQDTGTGGSWPVSTDRVVWALGALETAKFLTGAARASFVERAYGAMLRTIDRDRAVVFDAKDGLYRGEQSFLDWREQTYPAWVTEDLAHVAQSRTLSTNVLHLAMLEGAASFGEERGDSANATRLRGYASALRTRVRERFYVPGAKLFSTMIPTELDPAPARRFDWLGLSLAVLHDVATPDQAKDAVAAYPHVPTGAPVVWPQEQQIAVYHNRAIWPFVTAYGAKAAKKARNAEVVARAAETLVRGAATNLSHMENLEFVSGKPETAEGPVVNSRRQLWSVAGYVSFVHDVLFGLEATNTGLRFLPYLPKRLRATLLAGTDTMALNAFTFHGKRVTVVVTLPPAPASAASASGAYAVSSVKLGGMDVGQGFIDEARLAAANLLEITLADAPDADAARTATVVTDVADYKKLYAPRTPRIASLALEGGKVKLGLETGGEAAGDVTFRVYRDGAAIAESLPGSTATFVDTGSSSAGPSHCYTVEAAFASGTTSHRANPRCYWGEGGARVLVKGAAEFTNVGGTRVTGLRSYWSNWGDPGHALTASPFTAATTGEVLLQLEYANGAGGLTTGITCATKVVRVVDVATGGTVAEGYAAMPHRGSWSSFGDSTFVRAPVTAGKSYRVTITDDARSVNMSAFEHFATYTAGLGGTGGAFARADISALKILALQ